MDKIKKAKAYSLWCMLFVGGVASMTALQNLMLNGVSTV